MPNVMKVLRDEITRLARKEVKASVTKVHKPTVQLKHDVAALKRIVAGLEKQNRLLQGVVERIAQEQPAPAPETDAKARLTGKGIRSLRRKLKVSQADFGRLIGVTAQAVVNMEKKSGPLAVRKGTRLAILAVRGMGAREAKAKLAEIKVAKKVAKRRGKKRGVKVMGGKVSRVTPDAGEARNVKPKSEAR
jgi:DNA-binding transcriptional regulator YiaG